MYRKEIEKKYGISLGITGVIEAFDPVTHSFIVRDTTKKRRKYRLVMCDFHEKWSYYDTWRKGVPHLCPECKEEARIESVKKLNDFLTSEQRSKSATKASTRQTQEQKKERVEKAKVTRQNNKRNLVEWERRNMKKIGPYRIGPHRCQLKKIGYREANSFYSEDNVSVGGGASGLHYGLYYKGELVHCLSIIRHAKWGWEVLRQGCNSTKSVISGFSKLFESFIEEHQPSAVVAHVPAEIVSNHEKTVYFSHGFKYLGCTKPRREDSGYFIPKHRFLWVVEYDGSLEA